MKEKSVDQSINQSIKTDMSFTEYLSITKVICHCSGMKRYTLGIENESNSFSLQHENSQDVRQFNI